MNSHGGHADGLDPRYEALRHAALHARAEAFPLGFAVLTRRGVTGWRRALSEVSANQSSPAMPCSPSESKSLAPNACRTLRRSIDMVSGMASVMA